MRETAAPNAYLGALRAQGEAIADACRQCGACFTACPMVPPAGLADAAPAAVVGGILDLLRGGAGTPEAVRWATSCSGSGACISACDYGINPRFMVQLARGFARRAAGEAAVRGDAQRTFTAMARAARIVTRLQVPPEVAARLSTARPDPARERAPAVVFYPGCNVPRTPHIVLLALDLLDRLGVDYAVAGGTGNCCGVGAFRAGDFAATGRQATTAIGNLAAHGAPTVLSWCPSCQIQFTEVGLPTFAATHDGAAPFEMQPFLPFLAARAEELRALMVNRVERRVVLHERPGLPAVAAAVRTLLGIVPGLEVVEMDVPRAGVMANTLAGLPEFKRALLAGEFAAARAAGVGTLATVFHACHREICHLDDGGTFEVLNFMELLGEGMGIHREDLYRRLKLMADADAIIADTLPMIEANGLDLDAVRAALYAEFGQAPAAVSA